MAGERLSISNLKSCNSKIKRSEFRKAYFFNRYKTYWSRKCKDPCSFFYICKKILKNISILKEDQIILKNLLELDGIGDTQIDAIENFSIMQQNTNITKKLISNLNVKNYELKNTSGKFSNKKIMFTGGFQNMSRSEAKSLAENNGGKVLGSISKKLDILIVGDSKNLQERK